MKPWNTPAAPDTVERTIKALVANGIQLGLLQNVAIRRSEF